MTPSRSWLPIIVATLAMACAAMIAYLVAPHRIVETEPGTLANLIPRQMGEWHEAASSTQQVSLFATDENGANPMDEAYDDSLLRTYVDSAGEQIMVAIAYDHVQREEDRVHRPEICYIAQGFSILSDDAVVFRLPGEHDLSIAGRRMLTRHGNRFEAVSYWIRVGDTFTQNPWRSRTYVIAEGLAGRLHDGILVRVSELVSGPEEAAASFRRQTQFLGVLVGSLDPSAAQLVARRDAPRDRT